MITLEHFLKLVDDGRTDGRMDQRTDGRMDGPTDRWMDRPTWGHIELLWQLKAVLNDDLPKALHFLHLYKFKKTHFIVFSCHIQTHHTSKMPSFKFFL